MTIKFRLLLLLFPLLAAAHASSSLNNVLASDVVAPLAHFRVKQLTDIPDENEGYVHLYSPSGLAKEKDPKLRALARQLKSKVTPMSLLSFVIKDLCSNGPCLVEPLNTNIPIQIGQGGNSPVSYQEGVTPPEASIPNYSANFFKTTPSSSLPPLQTGPTNLIPLNNNNINNIPLEIGLFRGRRRPDSNSLKGLEEKLASQLLANYLLRNIGR